MKSLLLAVRFIFGRAIGKYGRKERGVYSGDYDFAGALPTMKVTETEPKKERTILLLLRYPGALRRIDCAHGGFSV
jgi:hypothetical protein